MKPFYRARLSALLLSAGLWVAAPSAKAADFPCPAEMRVGVSDLGYASYLEDGKLRGAIIDLVAALGERTGCTFRLIWYPRGRLFVEFGNGKVDLTLGALRDPARDQAGSWIPYSYTQFELLLTQDQSRPFRSLAEFVDGSTARLNLTRGISYPPAAQLQLARLEQLGRLEYVSDFDVVFRKIQAGRAEGALAPPMIHLWHTRRLGLSGRMVARPIAEWPRKVIGAYVSKRILDPAVRRGLVRAMSTLVSDGSVQKIYARHVGADVAAQIFAGGVAEILDATPR